MWVLSSYGVRPGLQGRGMGQPAARGRHPTTAAAACARCSPPPATRWRSAATTRRVHDAPADVPPGQADRAVMPVVEKVREGSAGDIDLMNSVDRQTRGAAHLGRPRGAAGAVPPRRHRHLHRQGYVYVDGRSSPLLAATNRRTATRLLWEALASDPRRLTSPTSPRRTPGPSTSGWRRGWSCNQRLPGAARDEAADAVPAPRLARCERSGPRAAPSWDAGSYDDAMTTVDLPLLPLGRGKDLSVRARCRVPRRPAGRLRPRPGRARPRRQGGARRAGVRARPPLPARRGHPVRRRHRRLVQAGPRRRRPARGGVRRVLRRALHGRVRRHPDRAGAEGGAARTWPPAARWPTWPGSARWRTPGTR